jgi:replicative DNA helicase
MNYWEDPNGMITRYFDSGGQVSTGWPQLDKLLYGGFSRGELNIFAGGSGSGKSLVMMNIALNWVQQNLHGVYITLELSEELTGLRTTAMLTNMSTKDIRKDKDTAALKVKMVAKKSGTYQVKALPAQSNINDIRSFLKEYQVQTGIQVDFMMIDYLDLLMPVSAKVSPNDLFVKDKYVSEELRNLAKELGILMVTASQLNRSAVEEVEFDHSHISGGISKINTADNVFGIFTNRQMRERGEYQIQCMKSRSSTGVGQKISLEYNIETMRITDPGEDTAVSFRQQPSIYETIKAKSQVTSDSTPPFDSDSATPKISADVQSAKLKEMINNMRKTG